jgi:ABC-type amino acid transport substrate-binding protein
MRKIKLGIVSVFVCLICAFSPTHTIAQIAIPSTQTTIPSIIRIGTRTAASAVGKVDDSDGQTIKGFCGDTFEDELRKELARRGTYRVTNQKIINQYLGDTHPRYNGLLTGKVEIECGTNSPLSGELVDTATNKLYKEEIAFSDPFHESGLKFLLKVSKAEELNNMPLKERENKIYKLKIGVVETTTTYKQLIGKSPYKDINPYDTRDKLLDDLDIGRIEAFVTDSLIIQTLLEEGVPPSDDSKFRKPYKKEFTIFPPEPKEYLPGLDEESYVIAIRDKTGYEKDLLDIINKTLETIKREQNDLLDNAEENYTPPGNLNAKGSSSPQSELPSLFPSSELPSNSSSLDDKSVILGIVVAFFLIIVFAIVVVLALARGHIFHQYGSGDNVGRDKVKGSKNINQNNKSQEEDL